MHYFSTFAHHFLTVTNYSVLLLMQTNPGHWPISTQPSLILNHTTSTPLTTGPFPFPNFLANSNKPPSLIFPSLPCGALGCSSMFQQQAIKQDTCWPLQTNLLMHISVFSSASEQVSSALTKTSLFKIHEGILEITTTCLVFHFSTLNVSIMTHNQIHLCSFCKVQCDLYYP